jgi:hypothetical protein
VYLSLTLKYVKKYHFYQVYNNIFALMISIKPLLDEFKKPEFSEKVLSKQILRFFGESTVGAADGAVGLIN